VSTVLYRKDLLNLLTKCRGLIKAARCFIGYRERKREREREGEWGGGGFTALPISIS
jgi:hypothetical protein